MSRKTGLGKGLDALIPGGDLPSGRESAIPANAISILSIDNISPNPRQPRTRFDPDSLAELADSIHQHGVIQPLLVTQGVGSDEYIIIAGERRWLAARQAGVTEIPVIVREASEQQLVEIALVENVQRADLSPLEAAEAYRQLSQDFGLSHEEISLRVGKSRAAVTNTLRLLKLPDDVRQALHEGLIAEGHARALLALTTPEAQSAALSTILKHELTVRQSEVLVRKMSGAKQPPYPRPSPSPELGALEDRLRAELGTKVVLNPRRKGGTLVIHYYSEEELTSLVDRILGSQF